MRNIAVAAGIFVAALALHAQDWTPTRIVAITDYVPLANQARIFGDVVIKCYLNNAGAVAKAEVVSGHPLLGRQAQENALLWRFRRLAPPREAGDSITLTYKYRLEGKSQTPVHTSFLVDLPNVIQIIAPAAHFNP